MEKLKFDYFDNYKPKIDAVFMIDEFLNIFNVKKKKVKKQNYMLIQFQDQMCEIALKLKLLDRYICLEGYFINAIKQEKEINIFVVNSLTKL